MSRRENRHDNAVVESFFSSLKRESMHLQNTQRGSAGPVRLCRDVLNPIRKHVRNGMLSPVAVQRLRALMAQGV
jgi:putative transposase